MRAFVRAVWAYATNPYQCAHAVSGGVAGPERPRWSYFFQLHIVLVFIVSVVGVFSVVDAVREIASEVGRIPNGIVATNHAGVLTVSGVTQPASITLHDVSVVLDTINAGAMRAGTTTVFISKNAIVIAPQNGAPEQTLLWRDNKDFSVRVDDMKTYVVSHEGSIVTLVSLVLFVTLFVTKVVQSVVLMFLWSALGVGLYRLMLKTKIPLRMMLAFSLYALTGPLVVWALLVIGGFPFAEPVEFILFIVYSGIGVRALSVRT